MECWNRRTNKWKPEQLVSFLAAYPGLLALWADISERLFGWGTGYINLIQELCSLKISIRISQEKRWNKCPQVYMIGCQRGESMSILDWTSQNILPVASPHFLRVGLCLFFITHIRVFGVDISDGTPTDDKAQLPKWKLYLPPVYVGKSAGRKDSVPQVWV